ncbi:neuronal calcium sensor 1-like [Oppia nitens]|uniref:neuronal calcium sensor 1-like n=1 Tax=Oppia nitens TaxID=1686743 RepID=UPI0023DC2CB6|nr:neuronal calcium sensor 1-like [Oppia nitens]XP_054157099.1 neuronal calcium sensor 1-like [Oppia nitens]
MLLVIMGNFQLKGNSDGVNFKELASTTPFSSKQLKEWYSEFIHECPNGEMDKKTFMDNFGEHFFPADGNTVKLAEYVFKRFDTNQDGSISFAEFINAVSIPSRGNIDEKLDWCFSIYDIDEDGYITTDEMANVIKAIFRRRGLRLDIDSKVQEIFNRMDINKDGVLSKEEFIKGFKTDPTILSALVAEQCNNTGAAAGGGDLNNRPNNNQTTNNSLQPK